MINTDDNLEFFELANKLYEKVKLNMELFENEPEIIK